MRAIPVKLQGDHERERIQRGQPDKIWHGQRLLKLYVAIKLFSFFVNILYLINSFFLFFHAENVPNNFFLLCLNLKCRIFYSCCFSCSTFFRFCWTFQFLSRFPVYFSCWPSSQINGLLVPSELKTIFSTSQVSNQFLFKVRILLKYPDHNLDYFVSDKQTPKLK